MEPRKEDLAKELFGKLLPNMADSVRLWAGENPNGTALIEFDTGDRVTWKAFDRSVSAFAAKLLSLGLKKGDVVATSLPLLKEHVYLLYACYRIGVVAAPLDLRLKAGEIEYCLEKIRPKAYFFLGKTPVADFRPMITEVMSTAPFVEHWVQFQREEDQIIPGAIGITRFAADIKKQFILSLLTGSVRKAHRAVTTRDPALIIFTTGSTGRPKPALLCHENILVQNIGLRTAFEMTSDDVMLVNLPPSHVGCTTEQLATTVYGGGTSVILHIFDAATSLQAVQDHQVTVMGQIPALFNMQWRLPDYDDYDLSALRFVLYGGQAVSVDFLRKMRTMAPKMGSGLGLTETGGFCTYTDVDADVEDIARSIGHPMELFPMSIRRPMNADGTAGEELSQGETGEICFEGPQVFLGYLNDKKATEATVSREGICYTGDMGFHDADGLHFAGRSKLVIKPKGYQVFPDAIADHISQQLEGRTANVAIVGVEHEIFSEAIMAFVETVEDRELTAAQVMEACAGIAAYSRPSHVEILAPGEMPLNRVSKTDFMVLKERASAIVNDLRNKGGWDT